MRIVCLGGGPAGLYFALLMKKRSPQHHVTVVERNRADDTFGWGVVFSDRTLDNLRVADPESADTILDAFNHWDDIEVHFKGRALRSSGHGFCGIGRKRLLNILQARCIAVGVELVFESSADDRDFHADLIVAADGLNSRIRDKYAATYQPQVDLRACRFVWLGTSRLFEAFTFAFEETEWGWFQCNAYRFDESTSTFVVEATEDVWRRAGIDSMDKAESVALCERIFAKQLQGHKLLSNASHLRGSAQWIRFPQVACKTWIHYGDNGPVVLLGDAAHTANYLIGSGTKLALEGAIQLAESFSIFSGDMEKAVAHYMETHRVAVERLQCAARSSADWFENVECNAALAPEAFYYSLLTRSQRISHESLRKRDKRYVSSHEQWIARRAGLSLREDAAPPMPSFTPFTLRQITIPSRLVGALNDARIGFNHDSREQWCRKYFDVCAEKHVGLVFAEGVSAASDEANVLWPGLFKSAHVAEWKEIVERVHGDVHAKMAVRLGDNVYPGNENFSKGCPSRVRDNFIRAAAMLSEAGIDWLELEWVYDAAELHHPSSANRRQHHGCGGLQYAGEIFEAVRATWPTHKPISMRIVAERVGENILFENKALEVVEYFKAAGVDAVSISLSQSVSRLPGDYDWLQWPFVNRIRNRANIPVVAEVDHIDRANCMISAGAADLCVIRAL